MDRLRAISSRGPDGDRDPRELRDQSPTAQHVADAASSVAAAEGYAAAARSEQTRRCYAYDCQAFRAWCESLGVPPMPAPPAFVAAYLAHRAQGGAKVATVERALAAISEAHRAYGYASPRDDAAVRAVLAGIRRTHGAAPKQARPLSVSQLRAMLPTGDELRDLRDRAILLLGFAAAMRSSELIELTLPDVQLDLEGLRVTLRRSKTDQEGHGEIRAIPYGKHAHTCPVRAVQAWVRAAGLEDGPLFRSIHARGSVGTRRLDRRTITEILRRRAEAAGLDVEGLSGHSLRSGFVTECARRGVTEHDIARQTGHRSTAVLRTYIRRATVWESNAAGRVGL